MLTMVGVRFKDSSMLQNIRILWLYCLCRIWAG